MSELETRLRHDLDAAARDVTITPDAWQRNQELVAADRSARPRRLAGWALSAAAVAVAVVTVSTLVLGGGGGPTDPADGRDEDPFARGYLLGPAVVAENLTLGGQGTRHELALSDVDGNGPRLCDRYVGPDSPSGGCTARDPAADTEQVAFDWLAGAQGDGSIRGVIGGVDSRVTSVAIWLTNGERVDAELQPADSSGNKLFGYTVATTGPVPMRLAAYGEEDRALEYVNLAARFGAKWVADRSVRGCEPADGCLIEELDPGMLARVVRQNDGVEVLVWPDVQTIQLLGADDTFWREFVVDAPGLLVIANQFGRPFFGGPILDDLTIIATDGANSDARPVPPGRG